MPIDFVYPSTLPRHVAIIMDGNGRWAAERGWPRVSGHQAGAAAVRKAVEAACRLRIRTLTLYAFSADNWKRPFDEVATLMRLFRLYIQDEAEECRDKDIRLQIIGRRDRLDPELIQAIDRVEQETRTGRSLHLRIAIDYSARDAITRAAAMCMGDIDRDSFRRLLALAVHGDPDTADVDLLIRTGREQRLSDFLLWELAYAELHFSDRMWPDFEAADLEHAMEWFASRQRRFGALSSSSGIQDVSEEVECSLTTSAS